MRPVKLMLSGLVLCAGIAYAQRGGGPSSALAPLVEGLAPLSGVPLLDTPSVEAALRWAVTGPGEPFRFADPYAVAASPATHGRWEMTSDGGTAVWRLRVTSVGAVSLNLGFARYRMPPGGRLLVHTPDGREIMGPFTEEDNESHGELWTPVVSGDEVVIEVAVPASRLQELEPQLGSVYRGFRDLTSMDVVSPRSNSCHVNVVCPAADPYRDQARSVVRLTTGGLACSGVLLNNTAGDSKPYLLTARHCGFEGNNDENNARSIVVYWNFESAACGGRINGGSAGISLGRTTGRSTPIPTSRCSSWTTHPSRNTVFSSRAGIVAVRPFRQASASIIPQAM